MKKKTKNADQMKIISLQDAAVLRLETKSKGQTIVHCHGVFDLLHPGHIQHLEQAKALGDILIVTVTSAPYVNKGPGRPYFSDEMRLRSLSALACVDYVVLSESPTADQVIDAIQPDIYVKGQEYADAENDVTGAIKDEAARVETYGGRIHFTEGVVFSSTKLINNNFPVFPPNVKEFIQAFSTRYSFEDVKQAVEKLRSLKVLVIGDIIIDQYVFCGVQGLMTKDRGFSVRYDREEHYLGGSLAIARHIASFSDNVTVCGVMGTEQSFHSLLLDGMSRTTILDLIYDESFRTVVKRRYLERRGIRNEYEKLFSINYLEGNENKISADSRKLFKEKLIKLLSTHDLVVVSDYGHGLIDQETMEILQNKAGFIALNCQTNSSNYGTNLITKYKRADAFTLDEVELRLAYTSKTELVDNILPKLMAHLGSRIGWVTLGSQGCMSISDREQLERFPALTLNVQDTVGAGDAFFALTSLAAYACEPACIGSFLGNIAGALAANVIGNSKAVSKSDLLKFASTLLNF